MIEECERYRDMLIKRFPNCVNVDIELNSNEHDFGQYYDVVASYDEEHEGEAIFIENNLPATWNDTEILNYVPDEDDNFEDY